MSASLHSSDPLPELEAIAAQVCDHHPDQVRLYGDGKGCIGFLAAQMLKRARITDLRPVYQALVSELDRRTR